MTKKLQSVNPERLPEILWQGVRVVTTETLATGYGTDVKNIQMNLTRNQERFIEGKHYFKLEGDDLQRLKSLPTASGLVSKYARQQVLWTERGAARMSKIVDTDDAWTFYEKMEQAYFRKSSHPESSLPDFSDEVAAARAWADEREAARRAIGYVEHQAKYIEHLENLFQPGMSPCQFCKQLNGVNVQQLNAFLADHKWLYDDQPKAKYPRWRVASYARDLYLKEKSGQVEQDDGDMRDTYKPILLRKGAVWIYRHYLKAHLPMKKSWNGEFTHDTDLAGA
ncbi:ORF6N domain-containing protein [Klebsiella oxytoca]|nr:ORF6N domain-containing protein [Klebsiella oxytoca]ELT9977645.1 ORF6N domain-containing protein [Klebsiella oxytoca]